MATPKLEVLEVMRKQARALRVKGRPELWEEAARMERRLIREIEAEQRKSKTKTKAAGRKPVAQS